VRITFYQCFFFFFLFSDKDCYYNRIHLIFLDGNPNVSSCDIYRPSWEYLKDCAKFVSITKALQTNLAVHLKKKETKESKASTQLFSPDETSGSNDAGNASMPRPIWNKAAKRKVEEEKINENVTSKLKDGYSSGGTGRLVAKAITDFSSVLSSFFNQWQETNMCQSIHPSLCKTYQELLMKETIHDLVAEQNIIIDRQCQLEQQRMMEEQRQLEQQHMMEEQWQLEEQQHQEEEQRRVEQQRTWQYPYELGFRANTVEDSQPIVYDENNEESFPV